VLREHRTVCVWGRVSAEGAPHYVCGGRVPAFMLLTLGVFQLNTGSYTSPASSPDLSSRQPLVGGDPLYPQPEGPDSCLVAPEGAGSDTPGYPASHQLSPASTFIITTTTTSAFSEPPKGETAGGPPREEGGPGGASVCRGRSAAREEDSPGSDSLANGRISGHDLPAGGAAGWECMNGRCGPRTDAGGSPATHRPLPEARQPNGYPPPLAKTGGGQSNAQQYPSGPGMSDPDKVRVLHLTLSFSLSLSLACSRPVHPTCT